MAKFVFVSGSRNPAGYVNVDLIQRASQDINGVLKLQFGIGDEMWLEGEDATAVVTEIKKHWPDRATAA
jgi:hypothetical protein